MLRVDGTISEIISDYDVLRLADYVNSDAEVEVFLDAVSPLNVVMPDETNAPKKKSTHPTEISSGSDDDNSGSSSCESMFKNEFDDSSEDDRMFDHYVDSEAEDVGVENELEKEVDKGKGKEKEVDKGKGKKKEVKKGKGKEKLIISDDEVDCADLNSDFESDEEVNKQKFSVFNDKLEMKNPVFKLGMIFFSDHKVMKSAIKSYAIKNGKNIRIVRSEALRVKAVCTSSDGCPWSLYASKMQDCFNMQIKTFYDEHKCSRKFKNPHVNSRWLSETYVDTFRSNPKIPVKCFIETVMKKHVVHVSKSRVYRTKNKALKMINGSYAEQFASLWSYMEEVRITNPSTTIFMKVEDGIVRVIY